MFVLTFFNLIFLMAITIATLNVNGLRNSQKREMVFDYLQRRKISVTFLQETHSEEKDEILWSRQWKGKLIFSHGNTSSRGVAILTSMKSGLEIQNKQNYSDGRWVRGDIKINDSTISLFSLYAPNGPSDRKRFFVNFGQVITNNLNNCIIAGDFNCQLDANNIYDQSKTNLINIIQENGLIDTWRHKKKEPGHTYYHKGIRRPSRIDYIFISQTIEHQYKETSIDSTGFYDHNTVIARLDNQKIPIAIPRWICNNDLLQDDQCKFRIENFWTFWTTQKHQYESLFNWWDIGKNRLKEIIKEYDNETSYIKKREKYILQKQYNFAISKNKKNNDEIKEIERKIKIFESQEWEKSKYTLKEKRNAPLIFFKVFARIL